MILRHVCEVCGADQMLDTDVAYHAGWDYPPKMGKFGVIGRLTCRSCSVNRTAWWDIAIEGYTLDMLSPTQRTAIERIQREPKSISPT